MERPGGGGHTGSQTRGFGSMKCLLWALMQFHIKPSSSAKADDPVRRNLSIYRRSGVYWIPPLSLGMTANGPLAFRPFWPQIGAGRLAVDEPLANRVRSGRKQP